MANDKDLGEELLKQNGLEADKVSDQSLQQTRQMLARELKRADRLKRLRTIILLVMLIWVGMCFVFIYALPWVAPGIPSSLGVAICFLGIYILVICAIICSIVAYAASRSVSLKQIQASLAEISEQLKRQSRDS